MDIDKLLPVQKFLLTFISDSVKFKDFVFNSALTEFQCDLILGIANVAMLRFDEFIKTVEVRKEILSNEKEIKKKSQ